MANEDLTVSPTIPMLEQKLQKCELSLKQIYVEIAAIALPTPEQIQNWDNLKEIIRIQIEKTRQSIKDREQT